MISTQENNMRKSIPAIPLPHELSVDSVIALLCMMQDIIDALETYYAAQLIHHYRDNDHRQPDLWDDIPDSDPPF